LKAEYIVEVRDKRLVAKKGRKKWKVAVFTLDGQRLTRWISFESIGDMQGSEELKRELGSDLIAAITQLAIRYADEVEKAGKVRLMHCGWADEGRFEHVIDEHGEPAFLIYRAGEFITLPEVHEGDKVIRPSAADALFYPPYRPVDVSGVKAGELYEEVYGVFDKFLDLDRPNKHILAGFTFMTYRYHRLRTTPYIFLVGDVGSGKTRALTLLSYLAYRPFYGVDIPAADIYTILGDGLAKTLLEDEIQGIDKDREKRKIYKGGYKRGVKVPRIAITPSGKRKVLAYDVFGPKAVAGEALPNDKGFLERFHIIQMVEGYPERDELTAKDIEELRQLRNELLCWSLMTEPDFTLDIDFPFKKRMKELYKPLVASVAGTPGYAPILSYLSEVKARREQEIKDSFEGRLAKAVISLVLVEGINPVPFDRIRLRLAEEFAGDIEGGYIVLSGGIRIAPQRIGKRLREVLRGTRVRMREEGELVRAWLFDEDVLRRVARKYLWPDEIKEMGLCSLVRGAIGRSGHIGHTSREGASLAERSLKQARLEGTQRDQKQLSFARRGSMTALTDVTDEVGSRDTHQLPEHLGELLPAAIDLVNWLLSGWPDERLEFASADFVAGFLERKLRISEEDAKILIAHMLERGDIVEDGGALRLGLGPARPSKKSAKEQAGSLEEKPREESDTRPRPTAVEQPQEHRVRQPSGKVVEGRAKLPEKKPCEDEEPLRRPSGCPSAEAEKAIEEDVKELLRELERQGLLRPIKAGEDEARYKRPCPTVLMVPRREEQAPKIAGAKLLPGFWPEFKRRLRLKGVFRPEDAEKIAEDLGGDREAVGKLLKRLLELGHIARRPDSDEWVWIW